MPRKREATVSALYRDEARVRSPHKRLRTAAAVPTTQETTAPTHESIAVPVTGEIGALQQ